jgi:hypothetical protein
MHQRQAQADEQRLQAQTPTDPPSFFGGIGLHLFICKFICSLIDLFIDLLVYLLIC